MSFSRTESISWVVAILIVACMGLLVWHGPFNRVNKPQSAVASNFPPVTVKIVTDPKTQGHYTPSSITVHVGQRVTFMNVSNAPHTVSAQNGAFDSGDLTTGGAKWTLTPVKTGTFKYFCQYHPLMFGQVIVQ